MPPVVARGGMKRKQFREGDLVEVLTIDRARGPKATADHRPKPIRKERWRAVVLGPSVMGPGWWVMKKITRGRARMTTYTVPDTEMAQVTR